MINVAVIGVGSIGVHHARIFSDMENTNLVGVVDIDTDRAQEVAFKYNCKAFNNYTELIDSVDAVSIAVPTTLHFQTGMDFLKHNKSILVEKPITTTIEEADRLIEEAEKKNLIFQVGHLERFNSGVSLMSNMVDKPQFIESQRLSPFLGRGIDVDVTLDLMIHDIDIILSLVNSEISDIRATGAKVLTENIDVAHAWIEFENGCIAEAVTSRMANETVRQLKVFQHNAYLSLDYQSQEITTYKKNNGEVNIKTERPEEKEPLKEQILSFIDCVRNNSQPLVSGYEGKEALKVALKISSLVNHSLIN
ncbi:MAG: Gfo/Idh/MocA family oxidoreductase [Candidatus Brocadiales bacterium]|nr:Gfo/Idh/MocA family oxidoreductase [Candidatus Brocadiales bacterium]